MEKPLQEFPSLSPTSIHGADFQDVSGEEEHSEEPFQPDDSELYEQRIQQSIDTACANGQEWDVCRRCLTLLAKSPFYNLYLPPNGNSEHLSDVSRLSLLLTAEAGCSMCRVISEAWAEKWDSRVLPPGQIAQPSPITPSETWTADYTRELDEQHLQILIRGHRAKELVIDLNVELADDRSDLEDLQFDFYVRGEIYPTAPTDGSRYPVQRPPNLAVSGFAAFEKIESCIKRCSRSCEICRKHIGNSTYPSRAIDVSPQHQASGDLALISNFNSSYGRYLTLSYCWGEPHQPQATTTLNMAAREKGFKSSVLPATIRDAVDVTRRLGFRYIWVDSLCIVQDSRADKKIEIAKMKSIFGSSFLTISAASASSAGQGFLYERSPLRTSRINKVPFWSPHNNVSAIELSLLNEDVFESPDPLYLRAWTLEESMLSRRCLIFTSGQIQWQCSGFSWVDGGFSAPGIPFRLQLLQNSKSEDDGESSTVFDHWYNIVSEYTSRTLTDPRDKLIAIDGLAQRFSQDNNLNYNHGIWKEDALRGLCWHHQSYFSGRPSRSNLRRSGLTQCPTWSWASVMFPCDFLTDYGDSVHLASIQTSHNSAAHELIIEGYALTARGIEIPDSLERSHHVLTFTTRFDHPAISQDNILEIWPDTDEIWSVDASDLQFLFLLQYTAGYFENRDEHPEVEDASACGLVLIAEGRRSCARWRRIGYFNLRPAVYITSVMSTNRKIWTIV